MRTLPFPLRIALAMLAMALPAAAATISVSPPQTIQSGINQANDGDIVLVAPGTYTENIDFGGRAITVTSTLSTDPATIKAATAATIIDGGSKAPTVIFHTSESNAAVLSYFTIQNGGASDSGGTDFNYGGIYVNNAAPTILGNMITHNNCWGISSASSSPVIMNNEISATQTPATGCGFTNGSGIFISGDLTMDGSSATISGNTIENNTEAANSATTQNGGAGIAVYSGSPTIVHNTIRNNFAPYATGGAIDVIGGSDVTIAQNLIYGNQAGCGGGAIAFKTVANTASVLYLLVQNNTMANNTGATGTPPAGCFVDTQLNPTDGGYSSPIVVFLNNIIAGNTFAPATSCYPQQQPSEYNQSIFDHNVLYNAGGSFFGPYCIDVSGAYGNLAVDPLFMNAAGNDFHLQTTPKFSPAIDAGNNSTTLFSTLYDFDGNARVQDATGKGYPVIDMGAYESSGMDDATPTTTVVSTSRPLAGRPLQITAVVSSASGTPNGTATFYIDRLMSTSSLGPDPVTLDSTGTATYSVNLANGPHSIYVMYSGNGAAFPPSVSVVTVVDIEPVKTSVSISAAPNPALIGQNIVFTVMSSSVDPTYVPSPIIVYDIDHGYAVLATVTPDATGTATFNDATLSGGLHTIVATFPGNASYSSSNSPQLLVTVTMPTTLSLVSGTNPVQANVNFTLTAAVGGAAHYPSGMVNFYSDGALIGSVRIVDPPAAGASMVDPTLPFGLDLPISISLPGGTHNLLAKYPGDDDSDSSVSNTVVEVVEPDPTTLTLAASPNPALAFQTVTLTAQIAAQNSASPPTGSVNFTANGKLLGTAPLNSTGVAIFSADLAAGTYSIVANFAATTSFGASSSAAVSEIVDQDASLTTMGVSPNPGYFPGGTEALVGAVKPVLPTPVGMYALPSGTITFYDGATAIATLPAPVLASTPPAMVRNLSVGTHTLTAVYSGDANYLGSTSGPVTLDILLRDFALTAGPSITIQTQHHKSLGITLTPEGGFTDTIALTCSGLPEYATCNFPSGGAQGSVALSGDAAVTTTVDIETDAIVGFESRLARGGVFLALLLPVALLSLRGKRVRGVRLLAAALALGIAAALGGCSGHIPGHAAPGTYAITITGKGAATGTSHTVNVTLVVTE